MRLDELFGIGDTDAQKEAKQLAQKVKGLYNKTLQNLEDIMGQNAEAFEKSPLVAFRQWFEHVFDKEIKQVIKEPSLDNQITPRNINILMKPLVLLASQNHYLKPKTGYAGMVSLLQLTPLVDKKLIKVVDKFFGTFVEKGTKSKSDPKPEIEVGKEYDIPGKGKVKWAGAMWVDEKQQPLDKAAQAAMTQKAIDDGGGI
tara:strand:- start:187 stop:786 length:600 start_codon:yes stop_codon:yes gene_type:complete